MAGTRAQLCNRWADDCDVGPAPDQPGIAVWLSLIMLHIHDNGIPMKYVYPLPPQVTYAHHGRDVVRRIMMVSLQYDGFVLCIWFNFYLAVNVQLNLLDTRNAFNWARNIFDRPTQRELVQNNGIVSVGNLMDPVFTGLPPFTYADLMEITLGPYTGKLAQRYITSIQEREVLQSVAGGVQFNNAAAYHQACSQVLTLD